MKLAVISSAPFIAKGHSFYAYSPYIKEMAIWAKHSDAISFSCPVWEKDNGLLCSEACFQLTNHYAVKAFNVKSFRDLLLAVSYSPFNFYQLFQAMFWADHIHLRCPGNIGLMGCIVQILFPRKKKTAKYAGNWDLKSKQPFSYRMQKWILNNTFLTRNMTVLVYGRWKGSTKNIKPFFTATYKEDDKIPVAPRTLSGRIKFLFVGTLAPGKRPLYAIQLIEKLRASGIDAALDLFGEGNERAVLENYINKNNLQETVILKGNQNEQTVRNAYQSSHFILLPSESEGWPKVIAEAMFWGCFPIASAVSCVPFMLDFGNRGSLLDIKMDKDIQKILSIINDQPSYNAKVAESISWSRQFTLDLFETEIKTLLGK
jgi:glycosyltransferase involved in cell wall biosynthesis